MSSKTIINSFYASYLGTIILLLLLPDSVLPDFYKSYFMVGVSFISIIIVFLFGHFFKTEDKNKNRVVEYCQTALAISIGLNGLGGLGLYKLYRVGIPYDKIMHFVVPMILLIFGVYFLMHRLGKTKKSATIIMLVAVFVGSVLWEGVEVGQDKLFGTKTAGVYGEDYVSDTVLDIVSAIAGLGVGAYWLGTSKRLDVAATEKM